MIQFRIELTATMSFKFCFEHVDTFRSLVDAIRSLVQDTVIECSPNEGFRLQAMDSSHVSMVVCHLPPTSFSSFICTQPMTIGLNLENLSKILQCGTKTDSLCLFCTSSSSCLSIQFCSVDKTRESNFELNLLDLESEELTIPPTIYECSMCINSIEFSRVIRDLKMLGDNCRIRFESQHVKLSVDGEIVAKGSTVIQSNNETSIHFKENEEEYVEQSYSFKYLSLFTKATSLSSRVTVSCSRGSPVQMMYDILNGASLIYYLAPRMDDE